MTTAVMPTGHVKCGTNAGYMRHWRGGELACQPCLNAHTGIKSRQRNRYERFLPPQFRSPSRRGWADVRGRLDAPNTISASGDE